MNPRAPTSILCYTADPAEQWYTQGPTRRDAELAYMQLILQERTRPPLYRIIIQYKVEQHQALPHQLSHAVN